MTDMSKTIRETPAISVIMAMHNSAATIGQTIQSLQNQTRSDWELVLMDDGSSDGSMEIVTAIDDPRVRLYRDGRNLGLPARLNQAVAHSRGRHIARVDSDDICFPERFEIQAAYLEAHPDLDVVACGAIVFASDGTIFGLIPVGKDHAEITARPLSGFLFPHPTWFGKAEWFRRNAYDPGRLKAQDQDLLLRTYRESRFGAVPTVLVGYRQERIEVSKSIKGRYAYALSMLKLAYSGKGSLAFALAGVVSQALKAVADLLSTNIGLGAMLQRKKLLPADTRISREWRRVWRNVRDGEAFASDGLAALTVHSPGRQAVRIGYVPVSPSLRGPGDKRRFPHYATRRNLDFEIADPAESYDLVVATQAADLSIWRDYGKGLIVYDLIDSYLSIPRTDPKAVFRGAAKFLTGQSRYPQLDHWTAIENMCRRADAVICSTQEQRTDIRSFCDNVHIVLDVHSSVAKSIKSDYDAHRPFRLVWEGLPHTAKGLAILTPVLRALAAEADIELHVVTDLRYRKYMGRFGETETLPELRRYFDRVVLHEWIEATAAERITACDLAIVPLDLDDPFAAGKPENKLLLLWRMGMPVVASATPAYRRAMQVVGTDLACANAEEWKAAIARMMTSAEARRGAAEAGRAYAETVFGEDAILAKWDCVFASIGFDFSGRVGARS